jgi:flagellar biosynthetic protein FliR
MKLALPVLGTLLFTDIILGIMSRTVPQMNIFMIGMPVKILLGLGVLLVVIPLYIYLLNTLISDLIKDIYQIISSLAKT